METTYEFVLGKSVPAHRHPNGGGWVADTAYVEDSAEVWSYARVYGAAEVSGYARLHGRARVYGCAMVAGRAVVDENAHVCDYAKVMDNARVRGDARVYGHASVLDEVIVSGRATVFDAAVIKDLAVVGDIAQVGGLTVIGGTLEVANGLHLSIARPEGYVPRIPTRKSGRLFDNLSVDDLPQFDTLAPTGTSSVLGATKFFGNPSVDDLAYRLTYRAPGPQFDTLVRDMCLSWATKATMLTIEEVRQLHKLISEALADAEACRAHIQKEQGVSGVMQVSGRTIEDIARLLRPLILVDDQSEPP